MKKKLFSLFAFAMVASMFCGCSDKSGIEKDVDPVIVERPNDCDDGITYDGSIAILSESAHIEDVDEAAALRFLGGITTEVTDKTDAVFVEGNPTNFVYDINEVLDRGGAVFFWEPKESEIIEWATHVDNLIQMPAEHVKSLDLSKVSILGLAKDGSIYTYEKCDMEAHDGEIQEVDGSTADIEIVDKGHDDIYDSSEYLMFAGIVGFLQDLDEDYENASRADSAVDLGTNYKVDIEVPINHGFGNHDGISETSTVSGPNRLVTKGLFSTRFNIVHAYDFSGKGDLYMVKATFQAHCNTFCKFPWQNDKTVPRHSIQGDVLRNVSFEVEPIVGSSNFTVQMAKEPVPELIPKEREIEQTTSFGLEGSLNIGTGYEDGFGIEGGVDASPSFNWEQSETIITHEWEFTHSSRSTTTVGYSIKTNDDFRAQIKSGDSAIGAHDVISLPKNTQGTISGHAFWVWQVPQPQKNTTTKGIEKLRIYLKDLITEWTCDKQWGKGKQGIEKFSDVTVDLPLACTYREEYGAVKLTNTFGGVITSLNIVDGKGRSVFNRNTLALEANATYSVCLPTRNKYNIIVTTKENGNYVTYELDGGGNLQVERGKPAELKAVNFSIKPDTKKAYAELKNTRDANISWIKVIELTGEPINKLIFNTKTNPLLPNQSIRLNLEPGKKYVICYAYKRKNYTFEAPEGNDQFIQLKGGETISLDAVEDFEKKAMPACE